MSYQSLFFRNTSGADEAEDSLMLAPRQTFGQRFRLIEPLGCGGFGQVWRSKDRLLKQEVALKISTGDLAQETLLLRRLPKERYVSIFDYVEDPSLGAVGYAMEILDPPWMTLERYYETMLSPWLRNGDYLRALRPILCTAIDLLESLQILHGRKYGKSNRWCHADIKPQNVYVETKALSQVVEQGWGEAFRPVVKIGDLGLARESGSVLSAGTMHYMAPEQIGARRVSPATDIFAVDQTITALITGAPADSSDLVHINRLRESIRQVVHSAYIADKLADLIRKMTLATPTLRPSAEDGARSIRQILESDDDWRVLSVFAGASLGIAEASDRLFSALAPSRNWVNRSPERDLELRKIIRARYRRGLLSRAGQKYTIRI